MYTKAGLADAESAFTELCDILTGNASHAHPEFVKAPEFLSVLKNLRLAALLSFRQDALRIHMHEYREDYLVASCPVENGVGFLFGEGTESKSHFRVRWIHVHEPSRIETLGLSMKYELDPRFVVDVLTLWREQAKSDQSSWLEFDRPLWSFVVVPVLRLTRSSRETLKPYQSWKRLKLKKTLSEQDAKSDPPAVELVVEHCNLAIFVSGRAEGGVVLSFSSDWVELIKASTARSASNRKFYDDDTWQHAAINNSSLYQPPFSDSPDLSMFAKLLGQLRTSYSRLRTGDAHTFLLRTLCDVTEDYVAVTSAFDAVLSVLQKRLDKEKDKLDQKDVRRLQKSVIQLSQLFRLVRPVSSVVDTFQHGKQWSGDAMLYVSDVRGNVQRFLDDTSALRENAKMLIDRFHQYSNSKTSSVLYALTLVTTVFVPGQFLTSLYGMNFQRADGKPSIPELNWEHGYLFFWLFNIFITGLTFFYYRKQQWI